MTYGTVFAIVILILDERSDPRLLGKMISLTSVFLWEQRARRRRQWRLSSNDKKECRPDAAGASEIKRRRMV